MKSFARSLGFPSCLLAGVVAVACPARADEQLFGFVRGAGTLPQGKSEVYRFVTLRTGKAEGSYAHYYLGDESWRQVTSQFHLWLVLAALLLLLWRIRAGRLATQIRNYEESVNRPNELRPAREALVEECRERMQK